MKSIFNSSDKVGIWASSLCLIHCISFPLLVALFPVLEVTDYIEVGFLIVSILAVYFSTKGDKPMKLKVGMWGILLVLAVSIMLDDHSAAGSHSHHNHSTILGINTKVFEILSYVSAFSLAITHYFSQRRYRACVVK